MSKKLKAMCGNCAQRVGGKFCKVVGGDVPAWGLPCFLYTPVVRDDHDGEA